MPNVGPMELIVILAIALIVLGPKKLPEVGKSLGKGMREFKDSISGKGGRDKDDDDDEPADTDAANRRKTEAAIGRPEGEQAPLEGEVVSERRP
jgi:sec-independent protein translocase protein TatA